jgi:MFS transporter, ACS family, D-galactonate transporter
MTRNTDLAGQITGAGSGTGNAAALAPETTRRRANRSRWDRTLTHYPPPRTRMTCLGIVVLATVVLYYQFYLIGAVSTRVLAEFHISFTAYGAIIIGAAVAGAVASLLAGIADRYGRANIITIGLAIVGLLCLAGIPHVHSKTSFAIMWVAIGFVEGVILVATPAMIRDFSPQVGRASAMGFWTLGPVLGSLAVSLQVSLASNGMPWQDHFMIAGMAGLAVSVLSALFLRELAPALRDQLMVSSRDRALIEARAKGIDVEASIRRPFRQMLKADIVGSALAIWLFLIIYSIAVGFFPVYFQTVFGFSQARASSLGDWSWAALAGSLLLAGFVSDKIRVRKPFMLVGAVSAITFTVLFALHATQPHTSYGTFVALLVPLMVSLGLVYAPWMASFTETVERRNPALTATGLSVWGMIGKAVLALLVLALPHVVSTASTLVQHGPTVKALASGTASGLDATENAAVKAIAADPGLVGQLKSLAGAYAPELATAAELTPATKAALAANPASPAVQAAAVSEISGLPVTTVTRVITLGSQDAAQLATAQAIDPDTRATLLANPGDTAAQAKAVTEIAVAFRISPAQAAARLTGLATLPAGDLAFMASHAPQVRAAAAQLTALGKVPAAGKALLATYGPPLRDPKVQAALKTLQQQAPAVKKAAAAAPGQWQHYFWIAVGGQVLFIPLIFLMAGLWDPRKARQQALDHEARVAAELVTLTTSPQPVRTGA